jgi:hypothetical protein
MFITELIIVFVTALLLTLIFGIGFRGQGLGLGLLFFFIVLFFVTWAGGLWLAPIGPLWWGVPWLSFLVVGLVVALLMAGFVPDNRPRRRIHRVGSENAPTKINTIIAIDMFFWILIVGLLIAIISGHFII